MDARRTGLVATLDTSRGFGFIEDLRGDRFFFHISDCADYGGWYRLRQGAAVSFEAVSPQPVKGPRACIVKVLEAV